MNFFVNHQLDFMMILGGICGFIFLFLLTMRIDSRFRKDSFLQIAFFTMVLLWSDRLAYLYRGNETVLGFWMVRITNFLVYASILLVENGFNNYLFSLAKNRTDCKSIYLKIGRLIAVIGLVLLIISQFTGLYYTFDETNRYQRAGGFIICYLMPLILTALQFIFILKNKKIFSKPIFISTILFIAFPVVAGLVQILFYGLSLTSISIALSSIIIYFFALIDQNKLLTTAAKKELETAKEIQTKSNELLHQTVEALASAVDANDTYTHGHSLRVALYSRKIAQYAGKSKKECEDIYLAGLLHDVGKIGIEDHIINKKSKLTKEEFNIIKQHPVLGEQILSKIVVSPYLSIGAHYHHERYDGTGYPSGLKGEQIPEIARIIAVADAYDAMTSKRSYRDFIPQMQVREELVKGMGTQFDPVYAKIMLHMLDIDEEYLMKEKQNKETLNSNEILEFKEYKSAVSNGLRITDYLTTIKVHYDSTKDDSIQSLLFYDSADARYYFDDMPMKDEMDFIDFCSINFDGTVTKNYIRDIKETASETVQKKKNIQLHEAVINLVKQEDHLLVKLTTETLSKEYIFALYDSSRYLYLAFTGKNSSLKIVDIDIEKNPVKENFIPRIAEKFSFINGPAGDIPNIQIDSFRGNHSEILELTEKTALSFHSISLPTSHRVWHCPMICLFTSDDGTLKNNYKELFLARMDGEVWSDNEDIKNTSVISKSEIFENWNVWKSKNKTGVDCKVSLSLLNDKVILKMENSGLQVVNQTKLPENLGKVYFYITGDQCAITQIKIL